ncbi:hypothetical protein M0R04_11465 [Candidatus Dojkabacteria bacterium]|jgi:hypothetical protein|nr:hypothetical protein [Candidatus Dojkabacteria bacterium]
MSSFLYDDNNEDTFGNQTTGKEFFTALESNDEKELLTWLKATVSELEEEARERTVTQKDNLMIYRGISASKMARSSDRDDNIRRLDKVQKFIVNHLYDLTETKVSQMTRIKPDIEVTPASAEWEDRTSAKVTQLVVKHLWYINNIDYLIQQLHRHARIFGESYLFPVWNPQKGDLHPTYVEAKKMGIQGPVVKTGDIEFELELPWRVLLQRKEAYNKCEYVFRAKLVPYECLKREYPDKDIKNSSKFSKFDVDSLTEVLIEDHVLVYEFHHKKTEYVPDGAFIKFTNELILESIEATNPFGDMENGLPCIRLTDLDVPGKLNGVSRYETVAPIQKMYDNINTLIAKNIYLGAHSKWVMPRGAVKLDQLGNTNTIIQYQGAVPPTLVNHQTTSPEVFNYAESLKQNMQIIYGSHGVSRGEVPPGVTATSALQFLNELETARATTDIAKHGFLVKEIAQKTIALAGKHYSADDGRLLRIVGKDNSYMIRHFDKAHLEKDYNVRFENSSGLPETKSAKYQRILDTMQRAPQMLSPERWEELLDLGNTEKMATILTAAVQCADSENEDILAGRPFEDIQETEDFITHWKSHIAVVQSRQFKEEVHPDARQKMRDHIYITEEAMFEKAKTNPLFDSLLATLPQFPVFYHEGYTMPMSLEQRQSMVNGATNQGAPVPTQIPGVPSV